MNSFFPYDFKSLTDLILFFDSEDKCLSYLEQMRWDGTPTCPHCGSVKSYRFSDNRRFKCGDCRKQYTAKVGTYFEASKLPLRKWFIAIWMLTGHKKGISSHQLAREIHVTQKTAWFMLSRIRVGLGLDNNDDEQLEGTIQADETFVGGLNKNRHRNKKVEKSQGRSHKDKTPVLGLMQQNEYAWRTGPVSGKDQKVILKASRVRLTVVENTGRKAMQPIIAKSVKKGSTFVSDEWIGYHGLNAIYDHRVVRHDIGLYTTENGDTTNAMEGFWTGFKLSIKATYQGVNKRHLQKYADEAAYRYNTRLLKESERLNKAMQLCNARLKYNTLIGKAA